MASSTKPEFPPLLPIGLHEMSLDEVRNLCVSAFPHSKTRGSIMEGLDQVIRQLQTAGISAEVWIDGSFVTEKIDPQDVDLVVRLSGEEYDGATEAQRAAIEWVVGKDLWTSLRCDSYKFFEYSESHPQFWLGQYNRAYWIRQFGFSRGHEYKGLAVVKVP